MDRALRRTALVAGLLAVGIALFVSSPVGAQEATPVVIETLDEEPVTGAGVVGYVQPSVEQNWRVRSMVQIGNHMFVGGAFTEVRDAPIGGATTHAQPFLAAFDVDTGNWVSSFTPQLDDVVWSLTATDDGRLVVGGEFDTVNGEAREGLVILDAATGATDASFVTTIANDGSAFEASVRALEIEGNWLYVGGDFNRIVDDQWRHGVYRVGRVSLTTGRLNGAWRPLTSGGGVFDILPDPANNQVHIAGTFTSVGAAPDTAGVAVVSDVDASVLAHSVFLGNESGPDHTYGLGMLAGTLWTGGSQHITLLMNPANYDRLGFNITSGFPDSIDPVVGSYVSSGTGGDAQFIEVIDGYLVTGCHCQGLHHTEPTGENVNTTGRPIHTYRPDGTRIDFFPNLRLWDEGPYSAAGDTNGCLWIGGDFTGTVDGFARFCSPNGAEARVVRPFVSTVGDDQTVEVKGRVIDPTSVASISLQLTNGTGDYLQTNGTFAPAPATLSATTSGIGTRAATASAMVGPLPEDTYVITVLGTGAAGASSTSEGLITAPLQTLMIGTGDASSDSYRLLDGSGGKFMRGQLLDDNLFGPQGYVPVDSLTILPHEEDLTAADLVGVDLMVMPPAGNTQYSSTERTVIEEWVNGGGIVVTYATSTGNDTVSTIFGLPITGNSVTSATMTAASGQEDHPIVSGIYGQLQRIGYSGRQFDAADVPANWTTLFENSLGQPTVVTGPYGQGHVITVSSRNIFSSQTGAAFAGQVFAYATELAINLGDLGVPPTLAPVGDQAGFVGWPVSLQLDGLDPDGGAVVYSADVLPDGVTLDANAGLVSGTPTVAAITTSVITVSDDEGEQVAETITWTLEDDIVAPDSPVNVLGDLVDDIATITWDPVDDGGTIRGYLVHRDYQFVAWVPSGTSYVDTGLEIGTTYRYEIRALDQANNLSAPSTPLFVEVPIDEFLAPGNVTLATNGIDDVMVDWDAVPGAQGYLIHRDYQFIKWVNSATTDWTDTTVTEGETYRYQVRAQAPDGSYSDPSPLQSITVFSDAGLDPFGTPANVVLATNGIDEVTVTWDQVSDANGYLIHRDYQYLAWVPFTADTFVDTTAVAGQTYRYQVRAQAADGSYSAPSAVQSVMVDDGSPDVTPPDTPPNAAVVLNGVTVDVTWDAATDDRAVTGYLIHRDYQYFGFVNGSTLTLNDDTVVAGTTYGYQVRAQDAAGNLSAPTAMLTIAVP